MLEQLGCEKNPSGEVLVDSPDKLIKRCRLINSAQRINAVLIRDASLSPAVKKFSEPFARYPVIPLVDLFSG